MRLSVKLLPALPAPAPAAPGSHCRLSFEVSDSGIGIPLQLQQRLFRPFVQADPGTARQFGGSGLGLSIARGLAERMGGSLDLASQPGRGTTLSLILNLPRLDDPQPDAPPATSDSGSGHGTAVQRPLVLVAEDHAVNRILIAQQLAHLGYPSRIAESGEDALRFWREGGCAMLLTDCHMGGMDGFELARTIRREEQAQGRPPMPIVACTADVYAGIVDTCLAAGMNGWIGKPVSLDALRRKLAKWLGEQAPAPAPGALPAAIADQQPPLHDGAALLQLTGGDAPLARDLLTAFADSLADERASVAGLARQRRPRRHPAQPASPARCLPLGLRATAGATGLGPAGRGPARRPEAAAQRLAGAGRADRRHRPRTRFPTARRHFPMNTLDCRVLVVDDHALQRSLLVRMLGALPVGAVTEASDGEQALARIAAAETPFDLVITDLDMPTMDGMELARRIAALPLPPPVALVSALDARILASVGTLSRAAGGALLSILPKPVSIDALREAITRIGRPRPAAAALPGFSDAELAAGLAAGEFRPWFEPQVDLCSGEIAGFEALVRWHHPTLGVLAPFRYIEQIERSPTLIDALTTAVLSQSLQALKTWQTAGFEGSLSVNLSPLVLTALDFASRAIATVAAWEVDPRKVVFELTESASANGSAMIENITRLRMRGFNLSIDDFGTGYSSLQQLSELPLSELKVDRCFTSRMIDDPISRAAVESSLNLAQRLSLRSCGEGIETADILRQLRWMGCTVGQGYLFTKPIPGDQVQAWLAAWPERRGVLIEEWRRD